MSKAIQGAGMLAGAVGIGAAEFFMASSGVGIGALPWMTKAMGALVMGGLSMEMGAVADALATNRGMNITTRQAASYRQISYGVQRVGGVEIYRSTTGSHHDQFNYCVVIATHECWGIESLYLDGRKVYFDTGSSGHSVRNGIPFGGSADGNDYTGPNGQTYNFGSLVYAEARYGDQLPGDVIGGFTANDPTWSASSGGSPYVGGCCYLYLKVEHDDAMFPGEPEIRVTVHGKPVYDPRTSTTAYSHNWALIVNDVLTDPEWGLGDVSVNQAQLIAAANVCDEQVPLALGGTESRYACHYHYDTSAASGDVLQTLGNAAGGRMSRIGGEWYIFPAYFQGPTATFDASTLTAPLQWTPTRSFKDLFNRVTGTYIAPNYPYNVAGNLYDSNGWYNGTIQNNFPFAFQPTNYPQYAADTLHGYASDQYLNEDGGVVLPKELGQTCVLSVSQAQRLAKIALLRNRQQGSGTFQMSLAAYQLQPCDTFNMTFAPNGWTGKLLEVNSVQFVMEAGGQGQAPKLSLQVGVNETEESVYEWSVTEELTVYDVPAAPSQTPYIVAPPTDMSLLSSAATAVVNPDGSVQPRIEVRWDTPLDGFVRQIQMQYQLVGATTWTDAGMVDVSLNAGYISGIIAGSPYNARIRSVRANGAGSLWVEIDGFTTGYVLASATSTDGYGADSLMAEAYSGGTATIFCEPFTARLGNRSISMFPSGAYSITGLAQQTKYWVYWIDATAAGGDVTPIATTNEADFFGKLGYFLIGAVLTPFVSTGVTRYYPSSFADVGSRLTVTPAAAFDGDLSTYANVSCSIRTKPPDDDIIISQADGDFIVTGFPHISFLADVTLSVVVQILGSNVGSCDIEVLGRIGAGSSDIIAPTATAAATATYSKTVPAGTLLDTVSVEFYASSGGVGVNHNASIAMYVYEVFIQA